MEEIECCYKIAMELRLENAIHFFPVGNVISGLEVSFLPDGCPGDREWSQSGVNAHNLHRWEPHSHSLVSTCYKALECADTCFLTSWVTIYTQTYI